ncbi:DNA helicase [Streptococcus pneumoniae]|uniref:UvrD-helicase domain-containing protein n=1 Tax=Streptococcus pneumoniae TaxID=1313 RepID=UPI0005E39A00|nr:UvrD-helicase domain-containing protein [Streptococcus pneumoniae]CIP85557.1 DNA helicase [Streptococcus pneumoniae]
MVKSDDWLPKGDIILENAALEAVKNVNNCLVIAGPGAGKTELLAQKLDYLFSTNECISPKKILALSFKTDAAANMKNRVKKRYGDEYASRFTSLTYSAFEKMILDQYINALPEEIRPDRDYLVDDWDVIKATLIKNGINVNGRRMSDIRKSVEKTVLNDEANLKFKKDLLKGTRNNKAVLLYKQITKLATYIIYTNKYIRKALQMTYEFVFLDEFQDTTYDQYNLLKTCFLGSTCKLTAVGDNKQAIMRWAGANPDIFQDYKLDFKANEYQLLMNHRSVPKLIEFQKEVHQILNSNHSSIQSNYYPEFQEGENSIPIMTIHKSKGLEYEVVYFLGLEDSAFWSFNDQPEEDKSAFFVALSRAKSHLIFTYCKLRNNSPQNNRNINEIYSLLTQSNLVDVIN